MCRRGVILLFFVVLVFVTSADVVAQIKIIPQTKLDTPQAKYIDIQPGHNEHRTEKL